jgi:hypothetical protein
MGETVDLPDLPSGWTWEGLADRLTAWLGDEFLADPEKDLLPPGCMDCTWILHSQFFRPPQVAAEAEPDDIANVRGFGFGAHAPEGWQRMTWAEAASGKGVPLRGPASYEGLEIPPCYRWSALLNESDATYVVMHPGVHPEDSLWPTEGSLGKADLEMLTPLLASHTTSTRMMGAFSPLAWAGPFGTNPAVTFDLPTMLTSMLGTGNQEFTPEFWWPVDRAWVVWTDYDLMGSKVFGSKPLIDALRSDPKIKTLDWQQVRIHPPGPPRPPGQLELRIQKLREEQAMADELRRSGEGFPAKA